MSQEAPAGAAPPGAAQPGYALVVGPDGADRAWVETTLLRGRMTVSLAHEADVLATKEFPELKLLVVDDSGNRETRGASLRRLQAHPGLKGIPVLVLAYDADIESFTDAITRGVAAYLVKPVSADELVLVAKRLSGWVGTSDHTERRHRLRRPLIMKVEIDIRARKLRVPGQIVDVSGSGCRVELAEELQPGDLIRIILQAHEGSTHVALGAETRWHRVSPEGLHVVGLRFTGTTALLAGKILGFVSSGMT
ncbi:MAG: PilZ domain-containing protein [Acidobacteria bacterium]|nr:PilZ domain-containing protein [Acidobacteriota bacterium]